MKNTLTKTIGAIALATSLYGCSAIIPQQREYRNHCNRTYFGDKVSTEFCIGGYENSAKVTKIGEND